MKKTFLVLNFLLSYIVVFSQLSAADRGWITQWSDDFNTLNWEIDLSGNGSQGTINYNNGVVWNINHNSDHSGEPQAFTKNNVSITSEGVVLTAHHEIPAYFCNSCTYQNHQYTSGAIESPFSLRRIKYGYIEARIKISDIYGMFPAFWTWIETGTPFEIDYDYDEIDVFEMSAGKEIDAIDKTLLENKYDMWNSYHIQMGEWSEPGNYIISTHKNYVNDYTQFHVYGLEWTPSKIIWYLDNNIVKVAINDGGQLSQETGILLNLAMFKEKYSKDDPIKFEEFSNPNFFDPPAAYGNNSSINTNDAEMVIDYINYYKLINDCGKDENYINLTDLNNHDDKVKNSITITGVSLTGASPKVLRADESIILNAGFLSANGQELYLEVSNCY